MAKAKRAKKAKPVEVHGVPAVSFKRMTEAFINTVGQIVLSLKLRPGGAANYGTDGLFVASVEALHTARASKNMEDFLKAAAYAVSAALKSCGAWEYPIEEPEPDEPVKKTKKTKKEGKKNGGS